MAGNLLSALAIVGGKIKNIVCDPVGRLIVVLTAKKSNGSVVELQATDEGDLKVSLAQIDSQNPLPVSEQSPLDLTTIDMMASALGAAIVNGMVNVNLSSLIAGENLTLGVMETVQAWEPTIIEVSTQIKTTAGVFGGFHVQATGGSAVVSVYDGVDDTGTLLWSRVVVAGEDIAGGWNCNTGIYVKIATDTATLTVKWK